MKPARFARNLIIVGAVLVLPAVRAQTRSTAGQSPTGAGGVDAAFQNFWTADSPTEAARLADEIAKTGVTFDDALRRLKQGRTYIAQETGVIQLRNRTEDGIEHFFAVNIPSTYDPARQYQVRFQLHGGVVARTENKPRGSGEIGALAGAEQIYVLPYAWDAAPWWGEDQILNLNAILDSLKRRYNIDENRVVLAGVSDGGTGAYYIAMRNTTPFASFLALNGFFMVLANERINDGGIFPNNLRNKSLFVVNGGRDRLYPTGLVEPFTRHLMSNGVDIAYHPQPDGEHNTAWWPEVKDLFEKFVADHPRNPHPEKITWQVADHAQNGAQKEPQNGARDTVHNRAHWLVIDDFGDIPGEAKELPDVNALKDSETTLIEEVGDNRLFYESKAAGRIDLVRTGNTVQAITKGVTAFTLLLSTDIFDFNKPVKVMANGREVFSARVERSVKTLLKWSAQDNDRTMLYGAEVKIRLTR